MDTEVVLDANLVQLIVAVLIPIVTGLLTKSAASATVKQVVSIVLVGAAALIINGVTDGGDAVFTLQTLYDAVLMWVIQIATYLGVYKPHDVNASLAPQSGLGSAVVSAGNLPGDVAAP